MTLGVRVCAKRKEMNISQSELARRAGLKDRSSISKIEKGRPASQKTIANIARALDVTVPYLMGWEKSPEEQASYEASILMDEQLMEIIELYQGFSDEKKVAFKQMAKMLAKA